MTLSLLNWKILYIINFFILYLSFNILKFLILRKRCIKITISFNNPYAIFIYLKNRRDFKIIINYNVNCSSIDSDSLRAAVKTTAAVQYWLPWLLFMQLEWVRPLLTSHGQAPYSAAPFKLNVWAHCRRFRPFAEQGCPSHSKTH